VKRLAALRRTAPPLARGDIRTLYAEGDVHAFARVHGDGAVLVIQHRGHEPVDVELPTWPTGVAGPWVDALDGAVAGSGDHLRCTLAPRSGRTLVSDPSWLKGSGVAP
jgi:hypothetical protein